MPDHSMIKDAVRKETGWAYDMMKWLDESEARHINKKLSDQYDRIADAANLSFKGNKLHTGNLSRGCSLCGNGYWSCIFMSDVCSAKCFFCPQAKPPNPSVNSQPIVTEGITFSKPEDYSDFLKFFNYKGTSFSGGDPLLNMNNLVKYIDFIKGNFGNDIYIWAYTNGSNVNDANLSKLKKAGLDELRINIAAYNYDTRAASLAKNYIDRVVVEIPAIPEDYSKLLRAITDLDAIHIDYLNIHKLNANRVNFQNFIKRNYTFLHNGGISILESEITALNLLEHAIDKNLRLPINYCSASYKAWVQLAGSRRRIAEAIVKPYENVTEAGYIRSVYITNEDYDLSILINELNSDTSIKNRFIWDSDRRALFLNTDLLSHPIITKKQPAINVEYSKAALVNIDDIDDECIETKINNDFSLGISNQLLNGWKISPERADAFTKILRDGSHFSESTKYEPEIPSHDEELNECIYPYENILGGFTEIY